MDNQTTTRQSEVIDIEEYAKAGKPVPKGQEYKIRVDKDNYTVGQAEITGKEILALAGKTPDVYNLYQHVRGSQTITIEANDTVDLTSPGVERFTTLKRANTEGIS